MPWNIQCPILTHSNEIPCIPVRFTMSGNSANPGIVPRAISEIFSMIEATAAEEKDVYFYVRLSLVELYNNNFR